jgi:hypothetical protein
MMIRARIICVLTIIMLTATSLACATQLRQGVVPEYAAACKTAGPTGAIDARALLDVTDVTTFRASEYTDCLDGRNILIVSWRGQLDVTNVNLARDITQRFFEHFHPEEKLTFTELHVKTKFGISTVVFQFIPAIIRGV